MNRINRRFLCYFLAIGILSVLCAGCKEYNVEVTVEPDGGGHRKVELTATSVAQASVEPAYEEFVKLFSLDEKKGWSVRKKRIEKEGVEDERFQGYIYTLERDAKKLADWHDMSGDINIRAAFPGDEFYDVRFHNAIDLEIGRGTNVKTITYRETFAWDSLKEELVAFIANYYHDTLAVAYPELGAGELAEIKGLMAGHLSIGFYAVEETGELDGEEAARSLVPIVTKVIRRKRPDVQEVQVFEITEAVLSDETERFERWAAEKMPGVDLAFFTEINLRVMMPGVIVESNADEVQDQTAVWKLEIMKTINRPVELYVRSELEE
jgi:hypothetical protein